ncbi:hypothetical protein MKX03_004223 [Papaver bracteatum]|nr:hypothetical protein MKX03_004223 [Papaver bracteatum]
MRHQKGIGTTATELPSVESRMRRNVERSDSKMSLIFLTACFIGINSAFLIGYITGTIGGVLFGTGYGNQMFPEMYNDAFEYISMIFCYVPAYLYGFCNIGIQIRKRDYSRLDMRMQMIVSGALVSMGSVLTALITSIFLFQVGPIVLAFGFGIMYQGAQVYMSEMGFAHKNYLASLNIAFKMTIAIGIFVANLVNCYTDNIKGGWGWKFSIGIAALPAAIISIGSYLLPDTPMSMIKLGQFDEAKQLLQRLHGTKNKIHILFNDLLAANEASKVAKGSEKQIMSQTQNRPYRLMAIALPLFQQLTGMNVIVLYAPYLFRVIGFGTSAALTYTAIIGGVNFAATIIGIISVSRGWRRFSLIAGGVQICVGQVMLGILTWIKLAGVVSRSDYHDYLIVATTCICVSGFAWSWGPLGWIFLSNDDMLLLYPLEVRSYGQNLASRVHWNFSSFMTLAFPFMIYLYGHYVLYLFAFFGVIICILAYYFMPDTNQILVEEDVSEVWKQHWFWRRYFVDLNDLMV